MHLVIIGVILLILLYFQFSFYNSNKKKIGELRTLFDKTENVKLQEFYIPEDAYKTLSENEFENKKRTYLEKPYIEGIFETEEENAEWASMQPKYEEVQLIHSTIPCSTVLNSIINSIDIYLLRNRNSAGDFNLMKDVVERNCSKFEEEIEADVPIPLYLGLMGTMLGIIVGIGYIALLGGGFSAFIANPKESIGDLMSGIALAMVASFFGILLTTLGTIKNKKAKFDLEQGKNQFYTWLQTELLPVVSESVAGTLATMQRNLSNFNATFADNVERMGETMTMASVSFDQQADLIKSIKDIDVKKVATANVQVLKELELNVEKFKQFTQYINSVNTCMSKVQEATASIGNLMERTQAVERMAQYFEAENESIEQRKSAIQTAIVHVDDMLKESFDSLTDNVTKTSNALKTTLVDQLAETDKILLDFKQHLNEPTSEFKSVVEQQTELLTNVHTELEKVVGLGDTMEKQVQSISELCNLLKNAALLKPSEAISHQKLGEKQDIVVTPVLENKQLIPIYAMLGIVTLSVFLLFLKNYLGLDLVQLF